MIVYVTADLLFSGGDELGEPAVPASDGKSGRRQLLVLVLFAAIVAHFVEVHFGIAIASTLTLFWVLAGVLVAVGMGWVEDEVKVEAKVRLRLRPAAIKTQPVGAKAQPAAAASGKPKTGKPARSQDARQTQGSQTVRRAASPSAGAAATAPAPAPALCC